MRICFICDQLFGLDLPSGYGKIIQLLGKHLTQRGVECNVITWQRTSNQKRIEKWYNMTVLSYPYARSIAPLNVVSYLKSLPLYKMADADVYFHIDARIESAFAMKLMSERKHIISFQDPYAEKDYRQMSKVDPLYNWNFVTKLKLFTTYTFLGSYVCQNADGLYTHARYLTPKIKRLFGIDRGINLLPNPVEVPSREMKKAKDPTVCFVGRWDPQKRVSLFIDLTQKFPEVNFILLGKGRNEIKNKKIKEKYSKLENLNILGFVSEKKKSEVLEKSWILVNTSIREALPITFLEALAHKTAILSYVNPDNFAESFGFHAKKENFKNGLEWLLENNRWKEKGEKGYNYVCEHHEANRVAERVLNICKK